MKCEKGFTPEALVTRYHDPNAPSYAEAFVNFLDNRHRDCATALARGTFPEIADPGISGESIKLRIDANKAKVFGKRVESSLAAARRALALDGVRASAEAWNRVFGARFPTVPMMTTKAAARRAVELDEGDEATDREIAEVGLPNITAPGMPKLQARLSTRKDGPFAEYYPSGGRALPKSMWLQFAIARTDIQQPYDVHWIVTNHGREARNAADLGHTASGRPAQVEHTKYRGSHTMTCELHRGGGVLARAHHTVNVR